MENNNKLIFSKVNYMIMIGGIITLLIGFFVMSIDDEQYGFGTLGLTIGPIIVLIGFIVEFFAIFYKPRKKE
ncbi:MAG: DUF3098 domain-containing protein [Cytophagaceae bacterium]